MVTLGGVARAFILLIVVYGAIVMYKKWLPKDLASGGFYRFALTASCIAITGVALITVLKSLKVIG